MKYPDVTAGLGTLSGLHETMELYRADVVTVRTSKPRHVLKEPNIVRIEVQVRILLLRNLPHAEVWSGIAISAVHNLLARSC